MKPLCAQCEALVGQQHDVDPHEQLKAQSGHRLPYGWRETYVCHTCNAGLLRVVLDPGSKETSGQAWTRYR